MRWVALAALMLASGQALAFFGGPVADVGHIAGQLAQLEEALSDWRRSAALGEARALAEDRRTDAAVRTDGLMRLGNAADAERRQLSRRNLERAEAAAPRDACARIARAQAAGQVRAAYREAASAGSVAPARAWTGGGPAAPRDAIAGFRAEAAGLPLLGGAAGEAPPNAALALSAMAIEALAPSSPVPGGRGLAAAQGLTEAARTQSARAMLARVAKLRYLDRIAGAGASHRARQRALQADLAAGAVSGQQLFGLRAELRAARLERRIDRLESALAREAGLAVRLLAAAQAGREPGGGRGD